MADMLSKSDFDAIKRDIEDAGKTVNIDAVIDPRYGDQYKSFPMLSRLFEAMLDQGLLDLDELNQVIQIAAAAGAGENGWTAQLIVDGDKTQQQINDITTQNTPSISSLRLFKPRKDGQVVNVLSHRAGFNLGGGLFKWDAENTQADNNFNVIAVSSITTGRFIRVLNSSTASIEQAGGASGEDVSSAINSLLDASIKTITGQTGATYTVNAVTLNKGVRFLGDFTITKPNKDARMFNLHTGKYTIEWDGVDFDGKYAGDGLEGAEDIVVTQALSDGLIINFKNCKNNNISKKLLKVGYPPLNRIREVNSIDCGGNGNHMHRGNSEERWIYETNNVTFTNIENYSESGDGVYAASGGVVTRMPMPVLYTINSRVKIIKPVLRKSGGFILYKACDNAQMSEPDIDETVYPFRVQQSKDTRCTGGSITNTPHTEGAILWQPYARINTELRRAEAGLSGLWVKGTILSGNKVDVSALGDHTYSGAHGVADCRARGVKIEAEFRGAATNFGVFQDADVDLRGSSFKLSATQQTAFNHIQTAANGALGLNLNDTTWDGTLRSSASLDAQIVLNSAVTSGAVQVDTKVTLKGANLHNMRAETQASIYWRAANEISISDNEWTGIKPKLLAIIRDNDYVTIKDNRGFTYPMNSTNGGNVNFADVATLKFIDVDISKQSAYSPSLMHTGNGSVPTYTTLALGSVAKIYNPVAGGVTEYVFTASGWKGASAITA